MPTTPYNKTVTEYCLNIISEEYIRVQRMCLFMNQSLYNKIIHTFKLMDDRVLPKISRDVIRLSIQLSDFGKTLYRTHDFEQYFSIVYKLFIAVLLCSSNNDKRYYNKLLKKL